MSFLPAHFSNLSRSLWMATKPSGVSATPPSFVSFAKPYSAPSSQSLMKRSQGADQHTEPLCAWDLSLLDLLPLTTTL